MLVKVFDDETGRRTIEDRGNGGARGSKGSWKDRKRDYARGKWLPDAKELGGPLNSHVARNGKLEANDRQL